MGQMRNIYHICPERLESEGGWRRELERAAHLGFDSLCCALPEADLFSDIVGADFTIEDVVAAAHSLQLSVMLDVRIDVLHRLAPDAGMARGVIARNRYLDPRVTPPGPGLNAVSFDDWENSNKALSRRWICQVVSRLSALSAMGVEGFRCLALDRAPFVVWRALLENVNANVPTKRRPIFAASMARATAPWPLNPGFGAAIVRIASSEWVGFATIAKAYPSVLAEPDFPAGANNTSVFEESIKLCAALADGMFMAMTDASSSAVRPISTRLENSQARHTSQIPIVDFDRCVSNATSFVRHQNPAFDGSTIHALPVRASSVTVLTRHARNKGAGPQMVRVAVINHSAENRLFDTATLGTQVGEYLPLQNAFRPGRETHELGKMSLGGGESRILQGVRSDFIVSPAKSVLRSARAAVQGPRLVIESVTPTVDSGRYPAKRTVGEAVRVEADVYGEGHDSIAVKLKWRAADAAEWREKPMEPQGNDRWAADFPLERVGRYVFTIEAWRDEFAIYRDHLQKKHEAGVATSVDAEEGQLLLASVLAETSTCAENASLRRICDRLLQADGPTRAAILLDPATATAAASAGVRSFLLCLEAEIPVDSERRIASFASWYQLFPRSQGGDSGRHGTFGDVVRRLPDIQKMGFDVVYLPPIHPIGATNRKGRNNSLAAQPGDPGSPYAIGSEEGGHDSIHPELGDFDDFDRLIEGARSLGMEVALDFAIQASPDHPWLRQHPEWFDWRPDGSIRYAENPPKKYEDIVNVDFYAAGATPALWIALRDIILLWVGHGVKLFRVDNPHTKPFPFWEWVIGDVRRNHPDVVFLSEAFTRPKVMYRLAKIGFSQSYTYFTWRNTKSEITEYLHELVDMSPREFFRPHFFVNTHDINPDFLQNAPRSAFLIRAALAATLSGLWGMYNGFELCEGRPDAKKKEYADSEKYQLTAWDWDRPGNIIAEITALNEIRRENPALQSHLGIKFHSAWNDNIIYFEKATPSRDNVVLVGISLDPHTVQEADVEIPLWRFGLPDNGAIRVEDLMRGDRFSWSGKRQRIRFDPTELPFSIWRLSLGVL